MTSPEGGDPNGPVNQPDGQATSQGEGRENTESEGVVLEINKEEAIGQLSFDAPEDVAETMESTKISDINPDKRLSDLTQDSEQNEVLRAEKLLTDFCGDFGLNLYQYQSEKDKSKLLLLEQYQDRTQSILCKILFETKEKRLGAMEVLGTKIIPALRKEFVAAEAFEDRYSDNEIPRGPKRSSGEVQVEIKGAEGLISLIANFDDPRIHFSEKRMYKEASQENTALVKNRLKEAVEEVKRESTRLAHLSLTEKRVNVKNGKEITFTIEDTIDDLAKRLASISSTRHPNKESLELAQRFEARLLAYIAENVPGDVRKAFVPIYRKKEERQALVVAKLTQEAYHPRELTAKDREKMRQETSKHQILKAALQIAEKSARII